MRPSEFVCEAVNFPRLPFIRVIRRISTSTSSNRQWAESHGTNWGEHALIIVVPTNNARPAIILYKEKNTRQGPFFV